MEEAAASIFYPKDGSKSSSETLYTDEPRVRHHIPKDITLQLLVYLTVYKFVSLILSNTK